jgi:hypothetical protein
VVVLILVGTVSWAQNDIVGKDHEMKNLLLPILPMAQAL